jgi:hypothetical protein
MTIDHGICESQDDFDKVAIACLQQTVTRIHHMPLHDYLFTNSTSARLDSVNGHNALPKVTAPATNRI